MGKFHVKAEHSRKSAQWKSEKTGKSRQNRDSWKVRVYCCSTMHFTAVHSFQGAGRGTCPPWWGCCWDREGSTAVWRSTRPTLSSRGNALTSSSTILRSTTPLSSVRRTSRWGTDSCWTPSTGPTTESTAVQTFRPDTAAS